MVLRLLCWTALLSTMCACLASKSEMDFAGENNEIRATTNDDWSYSGKTRPQKWKKTYPGCGMPLQSPIDLPPSKTLNKIEIKDGIILKGYDKIPQNQRLTHDGWSGKLLGDYENTPTMTDELLGDTYEFLQLHFHWGKWWYDEGSEHTVDGESYPLEIHFVHQSPRTGKLAVLGVFAYIDWSKSRKSVLFPLWHCFVKMYKEGDECSLKRAEGVKILDLLPWDDSHYYRYEGSTTTPTCLPNVTWTVFENPVPISLVDLALLNSWIGRDKKPLIRNYRNIQATQNREILFVSRK